MRPLLFLCIIPAIIILKLSSTAAGESLIATQITEANAAQLLTDSPDRSGGIGDWYLANGLIWAIIDDINNQTLISPSGGTLIDLGMTGRRNDQFVQLLQILNMNRDIVIPYDHMETTAGVGWAAITVSTSHGLRPEQDGFGVPDDAVAEQIRIQTEYRLNSGEQFLRLKTTVQNHSTQRVRIFNVADIIYWGDDTIKPFAGSENGLGPARGTPRGFQHPDIDTSDFLSLLQAIGGYTYIAGGGAAGLPAVSYGLCSPVEYQKNSLLWGINDRMVSAIGVFTGEFRRSMDLWKIPFFGIGAGEEFCYERILVVGGNNDAASATDIIFSLLAKADDSTGVTGAISPPETAISIIIIDEKNDVPVTQIRPGLEDSAAGIFKATLPPGDYVAEIHSSEYDAQTDTPSLEPLKKSFSVTQGFTDLGEISLPRQAALLIQVQEEGRPLPARVIIRGIQGTPDPELGADLLSFTVGGKESPSSCAANWLLLSGKESGPVRVGLRPGRYEVVATHGFEYSIDRKEVFLEDATSEAPVILNLNRVIDTPGMITGDFHVHSAASMDSAFPQDQRVVSFVAEGVELLIATDHDMLTDYSPVISALGLSDRILSIVGVEATSMLMSKSTPFTIGHYNAWPLKFKPSLPKKGMILDEGLRPRMLYERLHEIGDGEILIQVNHGRGSEPDGGASYFNALGTKLDAPLSYNSSRSLIDFPNNLLLQETNGIRDIDFDAMELLNGTAYDEYLLLRNDWFSLLNQGYNKTATANSDTHIKAQLAGYPRNYILLEDPQAERADEQTIVRQIRNQRLFGGAGPIVHFTVNGKALPGDLISPPTNTVELNVKISAAPWVPLDEVRVYANGRIADRYPVDTGSDSIVRFERVIPLTFERDTWLVVETSTVNANGNPIPQPPGGLYNIIAPGFVPIAFTNPIFIDIDGNGRFAPQGIPPTPPAVAPPWSIKASIVAAFLAIMTIVGQVRRRRISRE